MQWIDVNYSMPVKDPIYKTKATKEFQEMSLAVICWLNVKGESDGSRNPQINYPCYLRYNYIQKKWYRLADKDLFILATPLEGELEVTFWMIPVKPNKENSLIQN